MNQTTNKTLGILMLTAMVVGGIIGSGIFSLPQNMAEGAGAGAIIIAWIITLFGMFTLTTIFRTLATDFSEVKEGLYGYIKLGFGDYIGFNAAWGYWISAWISCTSYFVILFSALSYFEPLHFFGHGNTLEALIASLCILSLIYLLIRQGIYAAAFLNSLITLAKIIPIGVFILCVSLAFKWETFTLDFWGTPALGPVFEQVKSTVLYTVWVYLGIESATIYASRAGKSIDVSRATILGFLVTSLLLVAVSLLSLGVVPQHELAAMKNPSMALVLKYAVGDWGAIFINIGLIISISGALLTWVMLASEMLYLSGLGKTHTVPKQFGKLNAKGTPINSLSLTCALIAVLLVIAHLHEASYNTLIQLSTSMVLIPYLLAALFFFKTALSKQNRKKSFIGLVGSLYGVWLIYAGGLNYLLLSMLLYSLGIGFYLAARKQRQLSAFTLHWEKFSASLIVLLAVGAGVYFA